MGRARKVFVNQEKTTILDGFGRQGNVNGRMSQLKIQLREASNDEDREAVQVRLQNFASGAAVINIGGATRQAMNETKIRVEQALRATLTAIEEGIMPGDGVAYIRIQTSLDNLN